MHYRPALIFISLFFSITIFGQNNTCNCLENLEKTIQKTEENYAGYPSKVNAGTSKTYKQLVHC